MTEAPQQPIRCGWLTKDPFYIQYHDQEWGRPIHDSIKLFEMLCLEGQQAGLSWKIILDKRENYRTEFYNFEPDKIAIMTEKDIEILSTYDGIVRHKAKIKSIINNSKAFLKYESNGAKFNDYIWSFVGGKTVINYWKDPKDIPTETEISINMAKSLKKLGFTFVGSKVCYAFMQACGLVNDHLVDCCARNFESIK